MSIVISEKSKAFRVKFKNDLTLLVKNASEYGMNNDVEFDTCIMVLNSVLSDQILKLDQAKKNLTTREFTEAIAEKGK